MSEPSKKDKPITTEDLQIPILLSPYFVSDLQKIVLVHICTTSSVSYETLTKQTRKNRITIMQSLESLLKYHYVEKERINPELEKSKLIFLPTYKGLAFAWLHLNVDLKDMVRIDDGDEIDNYLEFIKDAFDISQQTQMLSLFFGKLEKGYLEFKRKDTTIRKDLIKDSFRNGILALAVGGNNHQSGFLYNKKSTKWLKKMFSLKELDEFKKFFIKVRNNLDVSIRRLPS